MLSAMSAQRRRQRAMPPGPDDRPRFSRGRDERDQTQDDRTTRRIALGGVILAVVALVLVAWVAIGRGSDSCQTANMANPISFEDYAIVSCGTPIPEEAPL